MNDTETNPTISNNITDRAIVVRAKQTLAFISVYALTGPTLASIKNETFDMFDTGERLVNIGDILEARRGPIARDNDTGRESVPTTKLFLESLLSFPDEAPFIVIDGDFATVKAAIKTAVTKGTVVECDPLAEMATESTTSDIPASASDIPVNMTAVNDTPAENANAPKPAPKARPSARAAAR